MRNGFNGLAAKVQTTLKDDPIQVRFYPVGVMAVR
jgi:transposase